MSVTFEADIREFSKTMDKYLKLTSKELSAAINHKAGRVAWKAIQETPKADKKEIEKLGIDGYFFVKAKKSQRIRKVFTVFSKYGRARNIVAARYWKRGEKIEDSFKLETEAQEMLKARLKSVGFVKSGWLPAYRALRRFISGISPGEDAKQKGKPKGRAIIAKEGFNPQASIANSAIPNSFAKSIAERGLGNAMRAETADMKVYIERKLKQAAIKTGIEVK